MFAYSGAEHVSVPTGGFPHARIHAHVSTEESTYPRVDIPTLSRARVFVITAVRCKMHPSGEMQIVNWILLPFPLISMPLYRLVATIPVSAYGFHANSRSYEAERSSRQFVNFHAARKTERVIERRFCQCRRKLWNLVGRDFHHMVIPRVQFFFRIMTFETRENKHVRPRREKRMVGLTEIIVIFGFNHIFWLLKHENGNSNRHVKLSSR